MDTIRPLPPLSPRSALFLDFDGTLADIAPQPDAVRVPPALVAQLTRLHGRLGGALAIVTGRPIADIDRFLHPLVLPVAGEHGAQYRMADGSAHGLPPAPLDAAVAAAAALVAQHPELLLERKIAGLALHYRNAPGLESLCRQTLRQAVAAVPGTDLLEGKFVLELKPRGVNKGQAIDVFMAGAPFVGRDPVFAGDDVTDEAAFAAVQAHGGQGIKVGSGPTAAALRCAGPAALREWIAAQAVPA
ncbi:trehalose-phosphatase [Xylophilus sp.]|uniref:trehalose-phosphatase n=1 Tax=Xylophilus sp. TaxID=2653893 RepID=UPI0013B9960F|nr:trehalose-phosphatase [Xylophilus sp.]KAF1046822.1 MAG: Trehalose-6-phosphate phosphatase [Xylophilus sp.]